MNEYNSACWLLGDEMKVETRTVTMMETINQFIGRFEACRLNESDMNEIVGLGIYDELSELETILHKISDKINDVDGLNESELIAMGVSGAVGSALAAIALSKPLLKAWAEDNLLPKGLQGASNKLTKMIDSVTGAEKAKLKQEILKEFEKQGKLEGLSSVEISAMINAEIGRQKSIEKRKKALSSDIESHKKKDLEKSRDKYKAPPLNPNRDSSEVSKTLRYNNMSDKERTEYNSKRFPSKHGKG